MPRRASSRSITGRRPPRRWSRPASASTIVLAMEIVEHVGDVAGFMAAGRDAGGARRAARHRRPSTGRRNPSPSPFSAPNICCAGWRRGTHDWRRFLKPSEVAAAVRAARPRLGGRGGRRLQPAQRQMAARRERSRRQLHDVLRAGLGGLSRPARGRFQQSCWGSQGILANSTPSSCSSRASSSEVSP